MKVYFIFDIKEEFKKLYQGNERILFSVLKQLYYLDKNEINIGYNLFSQLVNPINKSELDKKIFIKHHTDIPYSKKGHIHYINNLYRNEISRLEVKRSYIKLELEQQNSAFFSILNIFSNNFFACEFTKQDYFFITAAKSKNYKQIKTTI